MYSASFTFSAFDGVDLFIFLDNLTVTYNTVPSCQEKDQTSCDYNETEFIKIYNKDSYWEVTTRDECLYCGSTRTLKELPLWFKEIEHSERLNVTQYAY